MFGTATALVVALVLSFARAEPARAAWSLQTDAKSVRAVARSNGIEFVIYCRAAERGVLGFSFGSAELRAAETRDTIVFRFIPPDGADTLVEAKIRLEGDEYAGVIPLDDRFLSYFVNARVLLVYDDDDAFLAEFTMGGSVDVARSIVRNCIGGI